MDENIKKTMFYKEVEELFYKTHTCNSDDPEKEQSRVETYAEENNIEIID